MRKDFIMTLKDFITFLPKGRNLYIRLIERGLNYTNLLYEGRYHSTHKVIELYGSYYVKAFDLIKTTSKRREGLEIVLDPLKEVPK